LKRLDDLRLPESGDWGEKVASLRGEKEEDSRGFCLFKKGEEKRGRTNHRPKSYSSYSVYEKKKGGPAVPEGKEATPTL